MRMGTVWYILLFIIPYREWSCVWAGHIWLGTPEWIKYEILLLEYCSFSIDEVTNTGPSFSHCLAYDTRLTCMSLLWHVISAQETAAKTKSIVSKGLRLVDCVCVAYACVFLCMQARHLCVHAEVRGDLQVSCGHSLLYSPRQALSLNWKQPVSPSDLLSPPPIPHAGAMGMPVHA